MTETKKAVPVFMPGNDGVLSYRVIARNGNVGLGMRVMALVDPEQKVSALAVRFRSAAHPEAGAGLGDDETLDGAWPGIEFGKVNEVRASAMAQVQVHGSTQFKEVLDAVRDRGWFTSLAEVLYGDGGGVLVGLDAVCRDDFEAILEEEARSALADAVATVPQDDDGTADHGSPGAPDGGKVPDADGKSPSAKLLSMAVPHGKGGGGTVH